MHVKVADQLVLREKIEQVDCSELESHYRVKVHVEGSQLFVLEGQEALDLVMDIRPGMVEGKRFRFVRSAWAFHNLVAHPALQVLAWLGKTGAGFKIHDQTIPRPRRRKT